MSRKNAALLPRLLPTQGNPSFLVAIFSGVACLSLLAQLSFSLSTTFPPITGQSFGVALVGLLFGRNLAFATLALYLALGAAGLPVFANFRSGLEWSPTIGYLIGMLASATVIGELADRGWGERFKTAWPAALLGSVCIFTCGLTVLSQFVPAEELFVKGYLPYAPGDFLKSCTAAVLASSLYQKFPNRILNRSAV